MSTPERLETGTIFVSNSFTGFSTSGSSNGDDPLVCLQESSVSQTFFAGTSRRVQSVKEVVVAAAMVVVVLILGVAVTASVEAPKRAESGVENGFGSVQQESATP